MILLRSCEAVVDLIIPQRLIKGPRGREEAVSFSARDVEYSRLVVGSRSVVEDVLDIVPALRLMAIAAAGAKMRMQSDAIMPHTGKRD
jgi:hypothetical protein